MGVISLDLQQTDAGANKWSYNWLTDLPSINGVTIQGDLTLEDLDIIIPTKVSELENDAGYITEEDLTDRFYTKDEVYNKEETYNKSEVDSILEDYYTSDEVDTKIGDEATARADADSALSNRIDTNATNINSLAGDVAANSRAISDEATARQNADSALSGRIDTNAANIATNATNIAANTSAIATNTANIATNTVDIATNASNIATNTANIATNTADIATNAANIATNASAIAQNTSDIATNAANIATNTANIATNASNIATNTANIATNTTNIAANTSAITQNTSDITTNTANIATNASAIAQNASDIAANTADIATNTANIATNTANIATNASDIAGETDAREIADQGLQEQIDALAASSDVVDIVGTYAALQAYDTSKLHDNDIIKVLDDETRNDATTYYRWAVSTSTWSYIGAEGPFYTKADADATFVPQTRTINSKALSSNVTLTAQDVGALPDSTVIPTVNNATLTIQKNGSTVQTFTANSSSNKTANITVPTKTSDLTNDGDGNSNFATEAYVDTYGGKIDTIKVNGTTQTITNKTVDLTVPTKTSDLTNDSNFAVDANYVHTDNNFTTILKNKLNGIASGAEVNQNAFSNVKVGSTTVSADSKTDTLELVAGSNVTITPNATNDKVTIAATDTKYNDMTGATSSAAGSHGLVPAPATGDNTKFLSGDGTWKTVSQYELPIASANTLGGVKIGENLSITNTGVLSADAQHIDVDSAMSTTSENPVQNKVITTELNKKANSSSLATVATSGSYSDLSNKPTIDSALSTSSTNAVQNKVVTTALNSKADTSSLAAVATSGSYNDLSNKPTIPTVNNATLTIQKNGTNVQTFTANQSTNATANITVPTKTSDITNDSNFVASGDLAAVATSGSYNDLSNKPTIPTVNNATLTIQKNGKNVQTFTANQSSDATANITVDYVKTADNLTPTADTTTAWRTALNSKSGAFLTWYSTANKFTNQPSAYGFLETFLQSSDIYQRWHTQSSGAILYRSGNSSGWSNPSTGAWNTVATTANIGNGTLTIQKNGTNVQTFTANQSGDATANITVPTATSELNNDAGFIDEIPVASAGTLGGIKVGNNLSIDASGVLSADAESITVDSALSASSTNPVQNKVVKAALDGKLNTSGGAITGAITRTLAGSGTIANTNLFAVTGSTDGFKMDYSSTTSDKGITTLTTTDDANASISIGNTVSGTYTEAINVTNGTATIKGSVDKLTTARTIALGTGATGTATSFNGTSNITIPVTDVKDAYVTWGGKAIYNNISPDDAGCVDEFGHNKMAFLPANCIQVHYSTDGGSTWVDYGLTDAQKIQLVTYGDVTCKSGKDTAATSSNATNLKLRVRIATAASTATGNSSLYTMWKKILINVNDPGSDAQMTFRYRTIANYKAGTETWVDSGTTYNVRGGSGWNSIPIPTSWPDRFGGHYTNQTGQPGQIEFIFSNTKLGTWGDKKVSAVSFRMIGATNWQMPSEMARTGRLYTINDGKNATFPASIYVDNNIYGYNYYNRDSSGNYGHIGTSSNPFKDIYLNDGIYNGSTHLNLPTTAGTLALTSDMPTVNNATLTIQKNGTNVQTFTANSSTNKTANIQVPNLQTSDTDPGEGSALAADTFLGIYDIAPEDVDGSRLINNTVTRAKIDSALIDELFYKPGDVIESERIAMGVATFSGALTGGNQNFYMAIPVAKSLANISTATINAMQGPVRGGTGGYLNDMNTDYSDLVPKCSSMTVTIDKGSNQIYVIFKRSSGWGGTNNAAYNMQVQYYKITLG